MYPYQQEDRERLGQVIMRPIVSVALAGPSGLSVPAMALVDSGCSHIIVAPWLADDIGVTRTARI